ncbi:MAG: DUF3786 domain-containing protein [Dehalococcoidia bacterium]|nr:DUF3786 domain-containing protein [Dehalococcoidia bacterium]MDH4291204.1 DUF3786 domain-containing protein [Dehalococcoidia bacterium]
MTHDHSSLSGGCWERGFDLSYRLACEQLAKISDVRQQCRKSSAQYIGPNEIVIGYLNQPYHIMIPNCRILLEEGGTEVPLRDKILILHYFTGAKGTPATGKLIAYKQLLGGVSYFPAFSQRAIAPLVKNFGRSPELLVKAAAKLGGHEADHGDISVTVSAFPHVPITLVLWRGDEEVAPNGNILFDANIPDYLSTEDVTVLCETIIWKLVKNIPSA